MEVRRGGPRPTAVAWPWLDGGLAAWTRPRAAGAWVLALAVCGLAWDLHAPTPQVDDAYISYRYAVNLVAGEGLVFNPGERVEGYTNLLWVLLVALGHALGVDPPLVGHVLGVLGALACLPLAYALARTLAPGAPTLWAAAAPLALAASTSLAHWATAGLETCLFAALLTGAFLASARERPWVAAAAFAAATVTRPEGALAAGAWLGAGLLRRRPAWRPALAYAAFGLLLTGWRLLYYGDPVPNTLHAKVSGWLPGRGALYAGTFLLDGALGLLPPAVVTALGAPGARAPAVFLALLFAWVVAIGGDALGQSRFLLPALPLLAGLAAGAGGQVRSRPGAIAVALLLAAAIVSLAVMSPVHGIDPGKRARVLRQTANAGRLFEHHARHRAAVLRERGQEDVLLAAGAIGALGYYARDARILDILGLVDRRVARSAPSAGAIPGHRRSDADYVLGREPDYLVIPQPGRSPGSLAAVRDLWAHPEFERAYVWDPRMRAFRHEPAGGPGERAGRAAGRGPRHLVLVVVDTLRADRLGSYGAERPTTPALDALAAESVRFETVWTTAPWTTPSVASLLTGLWPSRHGAETVRSVLSPEVETLAERLRAAGYRTAAVVSHFAVGRRTGLDQGFEQFDQAEARGHLHVSGDGVTRRARAALDDLAASGQPFFLLAHYFDPHYQYRRHPEVGFAPDRAGRLDGGEPVNQLRDLTPPPTGAELGLIRALYDEEVRFTDAHIAALLEALRELGLWEQTLVIVTADHGEEFFEHGWLGHTRHLYEETLRVPLLVRVPGIAPRVVRRPVSLVSVVPTVLELLGIRPGADLRFDAPSLVPALRGETFPDTALLAEVDFEAPLDRRKTTTAQALRKGRWKLIRDERSGSRQLFDLHEDPGERRDRSRRNPERAEALARHLDALAAERAPSDAGERELPPGELEQLRALGYAE